jgi:hypothetical protein
MASLTEEQLLRWAKEERLFDDKVWVGDGISIEDVKKAVLLSFFKRESTCVQ